MLMLLLFGSALCLEFVALEIEYGGVINKGGRGVVDSNK